MNNTIKNYVSIKNCLAVVFIKKTIRPLKKKYCIAPVSVCRNFFFFFFFSLFGLIFFTFKCFNISFSLKNGKIFFFEKADRRFQKMLVGRKKQYNIFFFLGLIL